MEDIILDDNAMLEDAESLAKMKETGVESQPNGTTSTSTTLQQGKTTTQSRASTELFDTAFKDPQYPFLVTRQNVLDYFSRSPFYDKNCNNEVVREQNKPLEALKYMRGLEFATYPNKHEPRLFVVVKQIRSSELVAVKKALYYVLDQTIYQCPNVRQVCLRRIRTASENLMEAMHFYTQYRSFSCVDGRTWNFPTDIQGIWKESAEQTKLKLSSERQQVKRARRVRDAMVSTIQFLKDNEKPVE